MFLFLFLYSQYMSAMKIEELLDPKENKLPGMFCMSFNFLIFLWNESSFYNFLVLFFLFLLDELQDKMRFLKNTPDLVRKAEKGVEGIFF